jgi:hydrogenase small subunit
MTKYKGNYILAVEGNPPLNEDGMYCMPIGGKPFIEQAQARGQGRQGRHRLGLLRQLGLRAGRQAQPDAGGADHKVITDKPIIKVPGCPPIAEVMTARGHLHATFDKIPELDRQGRPKMFYSQRIHDKCYRRPHFDAGQFVEAWDDDGAQGLLPLQGGLQGPHHLQRLQHHALERGRASPSAGHGCIGCSEDGFWDKGSFYDRLTNITSSASKPTPTRSVARRRRGGRGGGGARRRQRHQARRQPQARLAQAAEQGEH